MNNAYLAALVVTYFALAGHLFLAFFVTGPVTSTALHLHIFALAATSVALGSFIVKHLPDTDFHR